MPKQKSIHDYGNKQITEIIKEKGYSDQSEQRYSAYPGSDVR